MALVTGVPWKKEEGSMVKLGGSGCLDSPNLLIGWRLWCRSLWPMGCWDAWSCEAGRK